MYGGTLSWARAFVRGRPSGERCPEADVRGRISYNLFKDCIFAQSGKLRRPTQLRVAQASLQPESHFSFGNVCMSVKSSTHRVFISVMVSSKKSSTVSVATGSVGAAVVYSVLRNIARDKCCCN